MPNKHRHVFVWLDGWMDGWMNSWSVGWMDGWLETREEGRSHERRLDLAQSMMTSRGTVVLLLAETGTGNNAGNGRLSSDTGFTK